MRSLIVYFAVTGILLCPYNCAVQAAVKPPVNQHAGTACCEHCRTKQASQDHGSPDRSSPIKNGRSCACAGAVFDASARTAVDTLLFSSLWAQAIDSAMPVECNAPVRIMNATAEPPLVLDGRQMRIVMLSFLL